MKKEYHGRQYDISDGKLYVNLSDALYTLYMFDCNVGFDKIDTHYLNDLITEYDNAICDRTDLASTMRNCSGFTKKCLERGYDEITNQIKQLKSETEGHLNA